MDNAFLTAVFSFTGVLYGFVLPAMLVVTLSLLFLASMQNPGASPRGVAKAIYCYLLEAVGILLMTAGALPTIVSVLAGVGLAGSTYFTLLLIFAAGGMIFLSHDTLTREVDSASRAVPEAIFRTFFQIVGHLAVIVWSLSFLLTLFAPDKEQGWWTMPVVMIAYGWLFVWATSEDRKSLSLGMLKSLTIKGPAGQGTPPSSPPPHPPFKPTLAPAKKAVKMPSAMKSVTKKTAKRKKRRRK